MNNNYTEMRAKIDNQKTYIETVVKENYGLLANIKKQRKYIKFLENKIKETR